MLAKIINKIKQIGGFIYFGILTPITCIAGFVLMFIYADVIIMRILLVLMSICFGVIIGLFWMTFNEWK